MGLIKYLGKLCCYFGWHNWVNRSKFHRNCINCNAHQTRVHYDMKTWLNDQSEEKKPDSKGRL
jgi:hypothetical protein